MKIVATTFYGASRQTSFHLDTPLKIEDESAKIIWFVGVLFYGLPRVNSSESMSAFAFFGSSGDNGDNGYG
jgi:hypothetical protein